TSRPSRPRPEPRPTRGGVPRRILSARPQPAPQRTPWPRPCHTQRVSLPQHCPSARELDDLELFAVGALAPARFEDADGLITLVVPEAIADAARTEGALELVEPEGMPI